MPHNSNEMETQMAKQMVLRDQPSIERLTTISTELHIYGANARDHDCVLDAMHASLQLGQHASSLSDYCHIWDRLCRCLQRLLYCCKDIVLKRQVQLWGCCTDQWRPHCEWLGHTHERIIHSSVSVGVILSQNLTHHSCTFPAWHDTCMRRRHHPS